MTDTRAQTDMKANLQWIEEKWAYWIGTTDAKQYLSGAEMSVKFAAFCLEQLAAEEHAVDVIGG